MPAKLLLLGHRGARLYAPENTIPAFDLSLNHGADGFEFDVRCTRSKQSIICHDNRFNRMAVRKSTLEQIHAKCSVDGKPPCLEDVLEVYSRKAFLNIEVKVRGMEQVVLEAVKRFPPQRGYFISSFLPSVVRKLHALDCSLVLGAISKSYWHLRRWKMLPVSYVVPHYALLTPKLVDELHAAGKTVITWTVNDPRKMLQAAAMGVDGIISDDTKLLVETLGNKSQNAGR
ncbi:MAG TPA: glycerophosphodiester phosphodiesterase [Candidatus Angelobacter sp.]|nr:glycerophosphodiester phosphodiesterase [Candidatus Angelobacter sp.]